MTITATKLQRIIMIVGLMVKSKSN